MPKSQKTGFSVRHKVETDETIGHVNSSQVKAQVSGCIWGLVRDGLILKKGQKIGDIDPRGKRELCFEIAAESRTIANGVLEAIRTILSK